MLTLLIGPDWKANRARILQEISEDVHQRRPGRILIVPELISHDSERMLCAAAGDTTSRFAEVLSFTRLAHRVAELIGRNNMECMDNGGRIVAMASATRQLHAQLKSYASVESKPEFLMQLIEAVDEFKRCCITPEDLRLAAEKTEGVLAQKLEELALIYDAYNSLCLYGKKDPRDQMTWLLDQLADCEYAQEHVFYVDGFPDFTRQNMAILEYIIRVSPKVVISINCDKPGSHKMAFEKAGDTAASLLRLAQKWNVDTTVEYVASSDTALTAVCQSLFQGGIQPVNTNSNILSVYRADTPYTEVCAAARKIQSMVYAGARYRDFSVVCASLSPYRNLMNMVFNRYHIPFYLSGTEEILDRPVIQIVLSALDAALDGFSQRDMLRYLRSMLSPVSLSEYDKLENYIVIWNISGNKWLFPWTAHPAGMGEVFKESDVSALAELNALRQKIIQPLVQLRDCFRSAVKLSQQVKGLYEFTQSVELDKRLDILAQQFEAQGEHRTAQILSQLWEILLSALEQLNDVLGETSWDSDTFSRLLRLLLRQYDVGTIPTVLDRVSCGPVNAMRCQQQKHLIVLGALEGALPGYCGTVGVLNDRERVALRELGVPLTGGSIDGLQAEMAEIYGVFCGAEETISVFCPGGQPSFLYHRLSKMAGGEEMVDNTLGLAFGDVTEASAFLNRFRAQRQAAQLGIDRSYDEIEKKVSYSFGSVNPDTIKELYRNRLNLSASQVDKQASCRLAYFLNYGIRAKERKVATVDPAEFGTYVHAVLEETVRAVMDRGGFRFVEEEETIALAKQSSQTYIGEHFQELDSQRTAYLFNRNEQELEMIVRELWQELRESRFLPVDFELHFGDDGKMPSIPINTDSIQAQLRGFVDRVDAWREDGITYFRVVDYKTGKKDFDYCDVFNGIGLQMLIYLFALEQGGEEILGENPTPAGVQYFPARAPVMTSDGLLTPEEAAAARENAWKRKGLLLSDEHVLDAMEQGKGKRLCVTIKDGEISGNAATGQQLQMLKKYIFALLSKMVDEIASGKVAPNPYTRGSSHSACAYCPYSAICHAENVEERRNYKTMTAERFWDEVEKEVLKLV